MPLSKANRWGHILVSLSGNVSIPNVGNANKVIFDQIEYSVGGLNSVFDNVNGRVYIPSGFGYNYARCECNVQWGLDFTGGFRRVEIELNGAAFMPSSHSVLAPTTSGQAESMYLARPWTPVIEGNYIQVYALQNTAGNLDIVASPFTWFYVEVKRDLTV